MEKVKEKIRLGLTNRKIITESMSYDNIPKEVKKIYELYIPYKDFSSYTKFTLIKYNGGGKLVNYGLNSFVRDIYVPSIGSVIYSDRFGNYFNIFDKDISNIIATSKVIVTAEGVLLFYNSDNIYATLNCKFGYIESLESLLSSLKFKISKIFCSNKKTYMEITDTLSNVKSYYLIKFSFDLYHSYSTQIKIDVEKIDKEYTYDDIINKKIFDDFEETDTQIVKTSERILNISTLDVNLRPSEYIKRFGKKAGCTKKKEIIDSDYNIPNTMFLYEGDAGIDDSINSFVNKFIIAKPHIADGIFKNGIKRDVLFQMDRFNTLNIYTDNINCAFHEAAICDLYISIEGVIVAIYSLRDCMYISISLDGVIWKKYKVNDFIKTSNKIGSISFSYKYCKNILTINEYNSSSQDESVPTQEYIIDFTFDFWSLYDSPVEAIFNIVEL